MTPKPLIIKRGKAMKIIKMLFIGIHKLLVYIGIISVALIVALVSTQVFCRYVLNFTFGWIDEVNLFLLVWVSFITMYLGVNRNLHLSIDILVPHLPMKIRECVIERLIKIVNIIFGAILCYCGIFLAKIAMLTILPASGIPSTIEYIFVPVAGVMIFYDSVMDLFGIDKLQSNIESELVAEEEKTFA
ncbi:MAG TPA: hypothetical protein DDW50_06115 [Firmicutes bacterium]|jgi:TRAP-type transport system small permease protein|nr:hypothetical protein [Bacillota bacterium]